MYDSSSSARCVVPPLFQDLHHRSRYLYRSSYSCKEVLLPPLWGCNSSRFNTRAFMDEWRGKWSATPECPLGLEYSSSSRPICTHTHTHTQPHQEAENRHLGETLGV